MLDKRENLATKLVTCAAQLRAEEAKPHCVTHADYDINNNAVANELFRSESGVGEHPITCLWQETGVSKGGSICMHGTMHCATVFTSTNQSEIPCGTKEMFTGVSDARKNKKWQPTNGTTPFFHYCLCPSTHIFP